MHPADRLDILGHSLWSGVAQGSAAGSSLKRATLPFATRFRSNAAPLTVTVTAECVAEDQRIRRGTAKDPAIALGHLPGEDE